MAETKGTAAPQGASEHPMNADDPIQDALDEMLESVPEEAQQKFRTTLSVMTVAQRTSPQAELMRKMTSENIHEFIQAQDASDQRSFEDRKGQRKYNIIVLVIGAVVLLLLTVILMARPDLLEKILPSILTFIAGAFGGYGYGHRSKSDD